MENIAEYEESLRQKDFGVVPVMPTVRLIHSMPHPQPLIKKGLRPRLKKQLIEGLKNPDVKKVSDVDPRFFELDLRDERYKDYPEGWLTILKQLDIVNHAAFKIGNDVWLQDREYLRDDEIVCYLVDQKDWKTITGFVVIELPDCVFEPGNIIDNFITIDNSLTIHRKNPEHNIIKYNPADIVKIWKVKTLVGRKIY